MRPARGSSPAATSSSCPPPATARRSPVTYRYVRYIRYVSATPIRYAPGNSATLTTTLTLAPSTSTPRQTRSTARFDAFLDDLVAGRPLGYSFHHVYPQALKIDVHAGGLPLPIKAIGRLENLNADLTQIASRYGRVANVTIPPAVRAHSNAADPCSRIERTPQILSLIHI